MKSGIGVGGMIVGSILLFAASVAQASGTIVGQVTAVYPERNVLVLDRTDYRVHAETVIGRQAEDGSGNLEIRMRDLRHGEWVVYRIMDADTQPSRLASVLALREPPAGGRGMQVD